MITDKELLELAAKAAGIYQDPVFYSNDGVISFGDKYTEWDPLNEDGDALRLAADLHIVVECMAGQSAARTFDGHCGGACDYPEKKSDGCNRDFAADKYAATRRAIVRAAAEIGKRMK